MRVTANQVTLLRLVLLPVPVVMVYQDGLGWKLGALAVYVVLGLTDALDGMLARRYGSTPLGELLDPIVDKIFLVAAYGPLADLEIVPLSFVAVMFARELGVTALRSTALQENFRFRTSRIAKLKTTVQMAGAGFLLLIWLFREDAVIWTILAAAAAASLIPCLVALSRRRMPGWKATWGAILIVAPAVLRLLVSREAALQVIISVILGFTLFSGLEYLWDMRRVLADRFRRAAIEAVRLAGQSLAIPALLLTVLEIDGAPRYLVLGVLAAELAVGGLDNSLVQAGRTRGPWPDLLRSMTQAVAGLLLLIFLPRVELHWLVAVPVWIALAVTLSDLGVRLLRNIDVFRVAETRPGASTQTVSSH